MDMTGIVPPHSPRKGVAWPVRKQELIEKLQAQGIPTGMPLTQPPANLVWRRQSTTH